HMQAHRCGLLIREGLHGVERQLFFGNVPGAVHAWIAFRTLMSAVLIRVLIVPRGSPVWAAISEWLSPSKNANCKDFCWSGGNPFKTTRTFSMMVLLSASEARLVFAGRTTSSTGSD